VRDVLGAANPPARRFRAGLTNCPPGTGFRPLSSVHPAKEVFVGSFPDPRFADYAKAMADDLQTLRNFVGLLLENHRMPVIFRVRRAYDVLWEDRNQLLPVQITSAIELDSSVADRIGEEIGKQTGRKVELTSTVDADILGGIVLRVGNSILDASIRHRLDNLRKQVATN
jgi:ATP synthase F1 delta subunit